MRKILLTFVLLLAAAGAQGQSLSDILGSLKGGGSSSSSSSAADILGTITQTITNATASNSFTVADLAGTWTYSAPAVSFKSDDMLKQVGGAAVATQIEQKLAPYYSKAGLTAFTLTVESDGQFTMQIKSMKLSGTLTKDSDNMLVFSFSSLSKVGIDSLKCMATKSGNTLNITFDSTRLIELAELASKYVSISSVKQAVSLLSSYKGLYVGFRLQRTSH